MKLRTTVQLSGAISSTIQKKAPLKREDSFLKRFSTRQIPETQETMDTGDDGDDGGSSSAGGGGIGGGGEGGGGGGGGGAGGGGSSTHAASEERRRRTRRMAHHRRRQVSPRSVINPDENFYFYWLFVLTACVLYNLWTLIVRQSFPELQSGLPVFWRCGDAFGDAIFLLDVAVQFRTGYLEQGLMVYNSKKLAAHYVTSKAFLLDLFALAPLDLVQLSPRVGPNPILRFPRFLKVYRLIHYYYMVESRTVYPNLWRVVNLVHILLILAHWFGCFYYLLSEAEGFQGDWVYPHRLEGDYATLTRKYLGSLYWSTLTLTTIGDLPTPETNADGKYRKAFSTLVSSGPSISSSSPPPPPLSSSPTHLQSSPMDASSSSYVNATYTPPIEASASGATGSTTASTPVGVQARRGLKSRLLQFSSNRGYVFTIVSYLIGVFIFATIVGQVGNVITNRNANRLEFERLLDGAKTYMRHHKVPGGMKRRVLRWYDYSWSRGRIQGGGDINTALGLLPDKLKTELALHVNLSVLKKVTIFQECQPEFLHDLVLKMKAYIFTPGDLICRKGEVAREMFIIADGILEVMSETGRVLTTMKAGDFFGEIGILNLDGLNKRTADVRSVGYSELFSLSREDVLAAMKDYPEAQEILQSLGRKRLMEARNSGARGGGSSKKAGISRSSTKMPGTPSPASTKSSPPAFGKCSYKENEESSSMVLRRQASSSSSSPALLDGGSTEHYSADAETGITGKKIVERLKNDVMGLRDVLRRSKKIASRRTLTSRQSTSNREGSSSIKGALRRMSRVKSDDSGGESKGASERKGAADEEGKQEDGGGGKAEVIGEGLPLLTRLRMLREKEERERKKRNDEERKNRLEEDGGGRKAEVIGEGLPLLTRLRMLREKEEKTKGLERCNEDTKAGKREEESLERNVSPEAERTTSASQTEEGATSGCGGAAKFRRSLPPTKAMEENRRSSLAEVEKSENETPRRSNATLEFVSIASTASQISVAVVPPRTRDLDESDRGNEEAKQGGGARTEETGEEAAISVLRREDGCEGVRCVVVQVEEEEEEDEVVVRVSEEADNESCCSAVEEKREHLAAAKPFLSRLRGDRNYASVDDLSPEYSGLPFVKKLKILNDRQRLAELEKSSSLDGGERIPENDARGLSRSLSDGSRVSHPPPFRSSALPEVASEGEANGRSNEEEDAWRGLSPESNETPERRNLKSILKKLSGSLGGEEESKHLRRSLMRAQTVEGYAARHTKLAKSVTFNRDTLASPPRTPAPGDAFALGSELAPSECPPSRGSRLSNSSEDRRLREDEECAEEVIHGIERVFRSQLDEIHEGFRDRFRSLELEVKKRDEIISCLQKRIEELENKPVACSSSANGSAASFNNDSSTSSSDERNPFTRADSADTVVTADAADDSIVEREEKEDSGVARLRANRIRKEERRSNEDESSSLAGGDPKGLLSTWLGEDSNTRSFSSESSIATSSSSSSLDEHQEEHHRHQITTTTNKDWEVQMLAREFEKRQGARRLEEEGDEERDAVAYDRLARRFLRLSLSERELLERLLGSEDETEDEGAKKRMRKNETGRKGISRRKNGSNKAGERKWRRRESEIRGKAWIGQQVLNARSLEEAGSCSGSFVTRSASAGDLPPFQLPIPSLAALSNSMRGMTDKGICRAAGQMCEPDPEKSVVTISGECPSDASLSKLK